MGQHFATPLAVFSSPTRGMNSPSNIIGAFTPAIPPRSSPQGHNSSSAFVAEYQNVQPEESASVGAIHNHQNDPNQTIHPATRRSTRGKDVAPAVNAPEPVRNQGPRKQHYEFLRAPPELVAAFKEARTAYHDAVYAWWYSQPRRREEKPTADDMARAKLDPRVQRTGRRLNDIDAELTRWGSVVKSSTLTHGWGMHRRIRDEERKLDRDLYDSLPTRENATEPRNESPLAIEETGRPAKKRRVGATGSAASSTTSRASTHDTTVTTPEPDQVYEDKLSTAEGSSQRLKRKRSCRK